jgi:hypothetical protein
MLVLDAYRDVVQIHKDVTRQNGETEIEDRDNVQRGYAASYDVRRR